MTTAAGAELGRIGAIDGSGESLALPADARSVLFVNDLAAPLYGTWARSGSARVPSATDWDITVPGHAYMTVPVPADVSLLRLIVKYPGAVPAADVQAVIYYSPCNWPPFVGPLA